MEQPFVTTSVSQEERASRRDIIAMLSMLDYLIAQTRPIDAMSTHCLVLARQSLASAADHGGGFH